MLVALGNTFSAMVKKALRTAAIDVTAAILQLTLLPLVRVQRQVVCQGDVEGMTTVTTHAKSTTHTGPRSVSLHCHVRNFEFIYITRMATLLSCP